jgi:tetratricopeptide (TPR) repeat protein
MKNKLTLLLLIVPFYLFAQTTKNSEFKTISGFINHNEKALENVSIFANNTTRFSVSDSKGFYSIKAKVGETLSFSYVGFNKISVLIEDVTSILNIVLKTNNSLTNTQFKKVPKLGESNIGEHIIIPVVENIDGNSLNKNASSLTKAIQEKAPYLTVRYDDFGEEITYIKGNELNGPVVWEIDGVFFDIPYPIYILEVKEVFIFNNKQVKPFIRVNTTIDYKTVKDIDYDNFYFTDEEFYNFDAIPYKKLRNKIPFLDKYKRLKTAKALEVYTKTHDEDKTITNFHFELFNTFKKEKNSKTFLLKILSDYEKMSFDNPENLKALAYKYQEINEHEKAIDVYKKIAKLRPNHVQSYRDLANLYLELENYRDFWLTYKYFFEKGFKIDDNDIGEIISSEIISTYNLDLNNKVNSKKIIVNNPSKNINGDIRIVFEWNTTEAEFIIEFVNPNLQVYQIENSLNNNQALIRDQKNKGYTSKEIFIDKLIDGNYLVNLTYLGNKHYKPTIFKTTTYYNWGRPNQTKKIEVFDFTEQDKKVGLLKLNRRFLR